MGSVPGSGRSPGEGYGNPLQCSCLEAPKAEKPSGYGAQGHEESDTTVQPTLSLHCLSWAHMVLLILPFNLITSFIQGCFYNLTIYLYLSYECSFMTFTLSFVAFSFLLKSL